MQTIGQFLAGAPGWADLLILAGAVLACLVTGWLGRFLLDKPELDLAPGRAADWQAGYDAGYQQGHYDAGPCPPVEPSAIYPPGGYPPDTGPVPVVNSNNPAFWYADNVHALRDKLRRIDAVLHAEQYDPDTWLRDELAKLDRWSREQQARSARMHARILASVPRELTS